MRGGFS